MGINNGHFREFGRFRLDAENKVLWAGEKPIDLQLKEIELLCLFTERRGEILSKDEILDLVWADSFVEESNLSQHVYRLRKIFKAFGETGDLIQTVPRRGYRFIGEIGISAEDIVIERHSISRTLIEELNDSAEPGFAAVLKLNWSRVRSSFLASLIGLVVLASASGIYFSNRVATGTSQIKSIAVLPLRDLDRANDGSFGLGFADALITRLGSVENMRVVSTNAVIRYVDEPREPLDVGRELNVDAVIDGTLQKANGNIRVTLRVTRTVDGKQIWANSFDQSERDIFGLQDLIATQTAKNLSLSLDERRGFQSVNKDAYEFYTQGLYLFRRRETSRSIPLLKKAIELDPQFAKPWSLLAASYAMGDDMPNAESTIDKAIELDPNLAEAHAVRGFIKMFIDWDWAEAERSLDRSIDLDRSSVEAHHWRGILHQIRGRSEEAVIDLNRALELDPTSANLISDLGYVYFFSRDYDKAEELYTRAEALSPNIVGGRLMSLYELQGREFEAYQANLKANCPGRSPQNKRLCEETRRDFLRRAGIKGLARLNLDATLGRLRNGELAEFDIASNWYYCATLYTLLGDKPNAIRSLNRAIAAGTRYGITNFTFPFVAFNPVFDSLREEPGFTELLAKMNLANGTRGAN